MWLLFAQQVVRCFLIWLARAASGRDWCKTRNDAIVAAMHSISLLSAMSVADVNHVNKILHELLAGKCKIGDC
jgi:hypothetical protein